MLKKGDVVTVDDGSYSRSVINGELIHEPGAGQRGEQFVIIEIGCKFPVLDAYQPMYEPAPTFNNTVIQAIDSGKVVFIEKRFLRLVEPTHRVMINMETGNGLITLSGEIVEISDKLYKEIKKS